MGEEDEGPSYEEMYNDEFATAADCLETNTKLEELIRAYIYQVSSITKMIEDEIYQFLIHKDAKKFKMVIERKWNYLKKETKTHVTLFRRLGVVLEDMHL